MHTPMADLVKECGSIAEAARREGISRPSMRNRLESERNKAAKAVKIAELPDDTLPTETLIERRCEAFTRQKKRRDAARWLPITVNETQPFGLLVFGDEHADDNNCDWPELKRDLALCRDTDGLYACAVGDATNNWVGRLIREYENQSVTRKESRQLLKWLLSAEAAPWLFRLIGNHDCLTPEHEVLTRRGWIPFPNVSATDEVLGYNVKTNKSEWQRINEVVSFDYNGPLHSYRTRRFSVRMTPNHRVLCHKHREPGVTPELHYREAGTLPSRFRVSNSASVEAIGCRFSDAEIKIAAWILADGHISFDDYISIYQSKPAGIAEIRGLLDEIGLDYAERVRERAPGSVGNVAIKTALPQTQFQLRAHSSRRLRRLMKHKRGLPAWCYEMDARQFELFMGACIRADGSEYGGTRREGTAIIYGSERILSDLQALCVTNGWAASLAKDNRGAFRLNVCRRDTSDVVGFASVEHYQGKVWCLRVPHGNFMVRHDGVAHFTGNSWREGDVIIGLFADNAYHVADWEARIELKAANGESFRIHASHNFKGNSIYNKTHGPSRAAMFSGGAADLYLCGHLHTLGTQSFEIEETGKLVHVVRARGYKKHDMYAVTNGYAEGEAGASVFVLFNPQAETAAGRITIFNDPVLGAKVLMSLRRTNSQQRVPKKDKDKHVDRAVRAGRRRKKHRGEAAKKGLRSKGAPVRRTAKADARKSRCRR